MDDTYISYDENMVILRLIVCKQGSSFLGTVVKDKKGLITRQCDIHLASYIIQHGGNCPYAWNIDDNGYATLWNIGWQMNYE